MHQWEERGWLSYTTWSKSSNDNIQCVIISKGAMISADLVCCVKYLMLVSVQSFLKWEKARLQLSWKQLLLCLQQHRAYWCGTSEMKESQLALILPMCSGSPALSPAKNADSEGGLHLYPRLNIRAKDEISYFGGILPCGCWCWTIRFLGLPPGEAAQKLNFTSESHQKHVQSSGQVLSPPAGPEDFLLLSLT